MSDKQRLETYLGGLKPYLQKELMLHDIPNVGLPPKLYLVVFYQVSLVNQTKMICSDFRRPLEVLVVLYHMFIPHRGDVIKCSSMIVSVKDSVSDHPRVFFPWLLLVVE